MPKRPLVGRTSPRPARHVEELAAARRTTRGVDVEEHRAARVRRLGPCAPPAGEVPQHPRVDGAEREVGVGGDATSRSSHSSLVAEKYGSSTSRCAPGPAATRGDVRLSQRSAVRRSCHTIAAVARSTRRPVPDDDRLALVGDADAGDGAIANPRRPRPACRARRARCHRRRARPIPAAGSAGELPVGEADRGTVGTDRDGCARRSCRRRWRGRWRHAVSERSARARPCVVTGRIETCARSSASRQHAAAAVAHVDERQGVERARRRWRHGSHHDWSSASTTWSSDGRRTVDDDRRHLRVTTPVVGRASRCADRRATAEPQADVSDAHRDADRRR